MTLFVQASLISMQRIHPPISERGTLAAFRALEPWVLRACWRDTVVADDQIFFRPEAEQFLRKVSCPVFTLRRAGSTVAPWSADWDRAIFSHAYSMAVTWPGAGHWPHQERPEDFNAIVRPWMDRLPA